MPFVSRILEINCNVAFNLSRIQLNDAEDGCTVFVTNIPFSVDNDQLREFAEKIGPVKYALVCVDKMTEHSKGSGFIKFAVSCILYIVNSVLCG